VVVTPCKQLPGPQKAVLNAMPVAKRKLKTPLPAVLRDYEGVERIFTLSNGGVQLIS